MCNTSYNWDPVHFRFPTICGVYSNQNINFLKVCVYYSHPTSILSEGTAEMFFEYKAEHNQASHVGIFLEHLAIWWMVFIAAPDTTMRPHFYHSWSRWKSRHCYAPTH